MEAKRRIAIVKKEGITMRMDYNSLTDKGFEASLEELAGKLNIDKGSILTYTLGDEGEMEQGNMYFCPRCGAYNEYAYEPNTITYYQKGSDEPAGFFKQVVIDCNNCDEYFTVHTEKFEEESRELTKMFGYFRKYCCFSTNFKIQIYN